MPAFLETDRLVLRGFTEDDVDHLYELNSDRDVMWFLTGGEPTPREEVRSRIIPFFLIRKCFTELGVNRVVAHTMAVNQPSRRVMEKCGLTFVRGYHLDDVPAIPGAEQGAVEYALTRSEWQASS
jgi:RimJ/RimL family protein N-acetyltransferase